MSADRELSTIAAHWEHFALVDIAPDAPPIQRDEMQRAFMAGAISTVHLFAGCVTHADYAVKIDELVAEVLAWQAAWNARKGVGR